MNQSRLCLTCSTPFEVPASSHRKYCSPKCWPTPGNHPRKPRMRTIECASCGKAFERKAWIVEQNERKGWPQYCSATCRDDAKRGKRGEERVERVTLKCSVCSKSFQVLPHEQKKRRTCSRQCAGKHRGTGPKPQREHRYVDPEGYVLVYVPPEERPAHTPQKGRYGEHRVVMAKMLGRWPEPHETVHHINGDKTDNRPENLQLRNGRHGKGGVLRCRACGSHDIEHVEV